MKNRKINPQSILVVLYNEVEDFPPTLNAIKVLSQQFQRVIVLHLKNKYAGTLGKIPKVDVHYIESKNQTYIGRIVNYFKFIKLTKKLINESKPKIILFFEPIAAMTGYLLKLYRENKYLLWYHNHDVARRHELSRTNLNFWASYYEERMISKLQMLSLPSEERIKYFDLNQFSGRIFTIPNYPLLESFIKYTTNGPSESDVKIVYQGRIDEGKGLEEVIKLLNQKILNKEFILVLKGPVDEGYKNWLQKLAHEHDVSSSVKFYPVTSYDEIPSFTSGCHIGLAIFTKQDIMNITLGTASNKVYEYMACGLPFIYYDTPHFRNHFQHMEWAFPTDLTGDSLNESFRSILLNYPELSRMAKQNFIEFKNFEVFFTEACDYAKDLQTKTDLQSSFLVQQKSSTT